MPLSPARRIPWIMALSAATALLAAAAQTFAATPPALVNYQGVLRDAGDRPLSGTFDMTFTFFDAQSAGNSILIDGHTSGNANAVTVTGGLFNVALGGGTVSDGLGPGTYTSLSQVFSDYAAVWMEINVGSETLAPRVRVQAEPYALNSSNLEGKGAASFVDTSATGQTKAGHLTVNGGVDASATGFGINATGTQAGGAFGAGSAFAYVADTGVINTGIRAQGNDAGGWFKNGTIGFSEVFLAKPNTGIVASGANGGYFQDPFGDYALTAANGYGLSGNGTTAGGLFNAVNGSSTATIASTAYAVDATGISALGSKAGRFQDSTSGAVNLLADPTYGFYSSGLNGGGFVSNTGGSSTTIANGNWGLHAVGRFCGVGCGGGGNFQDSNPSGATTYVAYNDVGIETHASGSGGSFYNTNGIATALAWSSVGMSSNGSKNFIQNHPEDPGAVIAYTSLEGDEAGTYTRGTASLTNGEARIPLGETFKWVTNPDLGLTVHLTPVGGWADLYVVSKSTSAIVVRSLDPHATGVDFDYIVFGLREGFENSPVVRKKDHEMPIPASASGEEVFAARPELERYTALSRFRGMRDAAAGGPAPLDLRASEELRSKIHVFDPARDGAAFAAPVAAASIPAMPAVAAAPAEPASTTPREPRAEPGDSTPWPSNASPIIVDGRARAGDVVTVTDAPDGAVVLASRPLDRGVVGILGGEAGAVWSGRAPLLLAGAVALLNVDATARPVAVGDLLVPSATPGHAMRADAGAPAGTVVAKALEPLEGGTAAIRVLVLSR